MWHEVAYQGSEGSWFNSKWGPPILSLTPPLFSFSSFFFPFLELDPINIAKRSGRALSAGSQLKSNLVHFIFKIWLLVATILMFFREPTYKISCSLSSIFRLIFCGPTGVSIISGAYLLNPSTPGIYGHSLAGDVS